jgi:hypothetical protein
MPGDTLSVASDLGIGLALILPRADQRDFAPSAGIDGCGSPGVADAEVELSRTERLRRLLLAAPVQSGGRVPL